MKRFLTIVAAFALVLGLSQCKKPNMPEYTGPIGDRIIQKATLTASNGDNGAKVDMHESQVKPGELDLAWEEGDNIYAYDGKGNVSVLTLVGDGGSSSGTFDGTITVDKTITTNDDITFYYYGNDVNVENIMTAETTIDFSEQYGSLRDGETGKTIKGKLMACGTAKYDPNGKYEAELLVPFAIAKLAFNSFSNNAITVTCDKSMPTGYTISKNGELTPIGGSDKASDVMTFKGNNSSNPYFAVFVPTYDGSNPVEKKYTFTQGEKVETLKAAFSGAYFTAGGNGGAAPVEPYFYFQAKQANSTVSMAKNEPMGGTAPAVNLEYSINGTAWNTFTVGTTTVTLNNIGDKVYFRADGVNKAFGVSNDAPECYNYFVTTGDLSVGGNIMYLLNGTDPQEEMTSDNKYCFFGLFKNFDTSNPNVTISDASKLLLPATTLAENCYEGMFWDCSDLTAAPELPATTLAFNCYRYMFKGSKINAAPELQATTLTESCYEYMFSGCTGLVTAPELPATTLAKSCYYNMFNGCTGLVTAPELPVTTLTDYCYRGMFKKCTNLTTAPELKATTLVNSCYREMFQGCSKLSSVTMLATNVSAGYCLSSWLSGAGTSATTPTVTVAGGKKTTIEGTLDKSVWTVNEPTLTVTTTGITPYLVYCECSGNASCDPQQNCEVGFVYSLSNNNPTVGGTGCTTAVSSTNKDVTPTGVDFAASLDYMDMSIGTYYVKAYAKVNGGSEYIYGVTKSIQINATVTFDNISVDVGMGTDFNFATKVYSTPSQQCDYGYVISKNENPTIEQYDYRIDVGTGNVDFYDGTNISVYGYDIAEGHYYIRAYAKGENGDYKYSGQQDFTSPSF